MLELNPKLDRTAAAKHFREKGWVQIRAVLTEDSARAIQKMVIERTPWGLAWQAGPDVVHYESAEKIASMSRADQAHILGQLSEARSNVAAYSFAYSSYPLQGTPHGELLEALNRSDFLELMHSVTNDTKIDTVDGQASLYAPGHYLAAHHDHEKEDNRRVAYVLSLTRGEWRPEWGGYLNFFNDDGDIEAGIRPRFNSLNLFAVPRWHNVSQVLADAPIARYAVTGWGRSS